jgi:ATP-dependent helicase HrpA
MAWGRDLVALEKRLTTVKAPALDELWKTATRQWERDALTTWSLGTVPERLELSGPGGSAMLAFPGLKLEDEEVCLRLFRKPEEAKRFTGPAWARLVELSVTRELAWIQKDLKALERHKIFFATLGTGDELIQTALVHLKKHLFPPPPRLDEASFSSAVALAQERTKGLVPPFADLVGMILQRRQELLVFKKPYASLRADLDRLISKRFLEQTPHDQLPHLLRYLKAMLVRAERASVHPTKDQERAKLIQPFTDAFARWQTPGTQDREEVEQFKWLLEEYKVSIFAQELGTAQPVSSKRLQALMEQIQK